MDYGSQTKCFTAGLVGKANYERFLCFCTTPVCNGARLPQRRDCREDARHKLGGGGGGAQDSGGDDDDDRRIIDD